MLNVLHAEKVTHFFHTKIGHRIHTRAYARIYHAYSIITHKLKPKTQQSRSEVKCKHIVPKIFFSFFFLSSAFFFLCFVSFSVVNEKSGTYTSILYTSLYATMLVEKVSRFNIYILPRIIMMMVKYMQAEPQNVYQHLQRKE